MRNKIMLTLMMIISMFSVAESKTIENLERVRAKTLETMFDKNITIKQRAEKIQKFKMKLLEMEKIVLNDNKLSKNPSNYTIKAFENFNSTFLVHSSLEKDKPITVNWLEEIGFTSETLLKTKPYRK